ncbi:membrane dipeptidase family protein [Chlamydia ibidis 10-1398/6]|nr:membrane dipeptidase family protein [Chlamydia ibidis 10-1398/6]
MLSHKTFSDHDNAVRCSPRQLIKGGVRKQVCAIFSENSESLADARKQNSLFLSLPTINPRIKHITVDNSNYDEDSLYIIRGIENASGLGNDSAPLKILLEELANLMKSGPIAYLGLVWNGRNRFGGGVFEPYRLTSDGKILLEVMSEFGIPVDLSHCCDKLADDILDYTLDKLPNMPILASHSNFRSVQNIPRNLPDAHAVEIARRGGVIGINIVNYFVGEKLEDLHLHLESAERMGILPNIVLGTDFFYTKENKFFPNCQSAENYPNILDVLCSYLEKAERIDAVLFRTAENYLDQVLSLQKISEKSFKEYSS